MSIEYENFTEEEKLISDLVLRGALKLERIYRTGFPPTSRETFLVLKLNYDWKEDTETDGLVWKLHEITKTQGWPIFISGMSNTIK